MRPSVSSIPSAGDIRVLGVSHDQRSAVIHVIQQHLEQLSESSLAFSRSPALYPKMATLVANRAMDVNGLAAAARTHTQAVTRNYISQPRLSM